MTPDERAEAELYVLALGEFCEDRSYRTEGHPLHVVAQWDSVSDEVAALAWRRSILASFISTTRSTLPVSAPVKVQDITARSTLPVAPSHVADPDRPGWRIPTEPTRHAAQEIGAFAASFAGWLRRCRAFMPDGVYRAGVKFHAALVRESEREAA